MNVEEIVPLDRSPIRNEEIEAAAAWLARRECEIGPPAMVADIEHLAPLRAQFLAARMKRDRDGIRSPDAHHWKLWRTTPLSAEHPRGRFHVVVAPGQAQGFQDEDPEPIWTWP